MFWEFFNWDLVCNSDWRLQQSTLEGPLIYFCLLEDSIPPLLFPLTFFSACGFLCTWLIYLFKDSLCVLSFKMVVDLLVAGYCIKLFLALGAAQLIKLEGVCIYCEGYCFYPDLLRCSFMKLVKSALHVDSRGLWFLSGVIYFEVAECFRECRAYLGLEGERQLFERTGVIIVYERLKL